MYGVEVFCRFCYFCNIYSVDLYPTLTFNTKNICSMLYYFDSLIMKLLQQKLLLLTYNQHNNILVIYFIHILEKIFKEYLFLLYIKGPPRCFFMKNFMWFNPKFVMPFPRIWSIFSRFLAKKTCPKMGRSVR